MNLPGWTQLRNAPVARLTGRVVAHDVLSIGRPELEMEIIGIHLLKGYLVAVVSFHKNSKYFTLEKGTIIFNRIHKKIHGFIIIIIIIIIHSLVWTHIHLGWIHEGQTQTDRFGTASTTGILAAYGAWLEWQNGAFFCFQVLLMPFLEKCEIAKDYHNVHPEVDFNGVVCYVRISAVQLWNSENSLSFPTSKVWAAKGCHIFFVFRRLVGLADFLFWHTIWCSLWEHSRFVGTVHLSKLKQPCTAVSPGYGQLQDQVGRWCAQFHFTGFSQIEAVGLNPRDHPCFSNQKSTG